MKGYFSVYILFSLVIFLPSFASSHHPQEFLTSIQGTKDEGMQIYNHFCVNCHAKTPKIPLGAPRIGEKADWEERLKQGMEVLFKHTDEGLNAMPPRGGCFECSDEQLALAVHIMINECTEKGNLNKHKDHKTIK